MLARQTFTNYLISPVLLLPWNVPLNLFFHVSTTFTLWSWVLMAEAGWHFLQCWLIILLLELQIQGSNDWVCILHRGENPPRGALEQRNSNNFKTPSHNLDRWDARLFDSVCRTEEGNLLKWDYVLFPSSYYETFLKWALNISALFRLMNEILQAGALQGSGSIVQSLRGQGWMNSGSQGGPLGEESSSEAQLCVLGRDWCL